MNEKTILEVMKKEHKRIEIFLDVFEKLIYIDLREARESFNKFKWNLEKHLFVEEKAIFEVCNSDCSEEIEEIFDLMREHGEIIILIGEIEKKLVEKIKPEISKLKEFLERHIDFEESKFYPMLDRELSWERKQEIFKRASEIIRE